MQLSALFVYPVKAARGVRVASALVTPVGLVHDRRWMIVDATGRFVSQREVPALRSLRVTVEGDLVTLTWSDSEAPGVSLPAAPGDVLGTRAVTIWEDEVLAASCGDEADAFLERHLGPGHALVRLPDEAARPRTTSHVPDGFHVSFADGYPFLVANEASRREVERRAGVPLGIERFRPNLVLNGLGAWEEDQLTRIHVGEVTFELVKPCVRCAVTTLDPNGGPAGAEPLRTLAGFRRTPDGGVTFGVNAVARNLGTVTVGDLVTIA